MSNKATHVPKKILRLNVTPTRPTITCRIPEHFNDFLASAGAQLETYTPEKKFLNYLGITGKRFHALMRGDSHFLLCEAAAYATWFSMPLHELYNFIPVKNSITTKKKAA